MHSFDWCAVKLNIYKQMKPNLKTIYGQTTSLWTVEISYKNIKKKHLKNAYTGYYLNIKMSETSSNMILYFYIKKMLLNV